MTAERHLAIDGHCDESFSEVMTEFKRNFAERDEVGASVCVVRDGRTVVDLWGGSTSHEDGPWSRDTIVVVFSCTKAATALCVHVLASRGELDLDESVGHYWPAFRQANKREITVRMLLNHQAGLPGVSTPLAGADLHDRERMVELMEREAPLWRPGSRHGYHAITFGWLAGEVVRRVTGQTLGSFFRTNIAEPLDLDFWIGLPEHEEHRVARTVIAESGLEALSEPFAAALARKEPVQIASTNSLGGFLSPGACDAPGVHQAEIPAANGITNARGLAGMYAALARNPEDVKLVDPDRLVEMAATESAGEDAVTFERSRFSPGFEKAAPGRDALRSGDGLVLSDRAFGHSGLGGSVGFSDPEARLAFAYTMNRHARAGEPEKARAQALIDAAYRSIGYRSCAAGKWSA